MPQLVRAGLRHSRWLETEGRAPLDFPSDVITDLRTTGDKISVFEVTGQLTAERIAIAFASRKPEPDNTAFAVFDRAAVEAVGIPISKTPGDTLDSAVNRTHYDLHVSTVAKLVELAGVIAAGHIEPILKKRVIELLRAGFENGQLDYGRGRLLCDKVKAKVPRRDDSEP